jgi:hypothetical protein
MPQNLIPKRQQIMLKAVEAATRIADALTTLEQGQADLAQTGGTFEEDDFNGVPGLEHMNVIMANTILGPVVQALQQARDTHLDPSDQNSPKIGEILRYVKRG